MLAVFDPEQFSRVGIALLLGMLVGLERQHTGVLKQEKQLAGIRTFALVALFGCISALLGQRAGSSVPFVLGLAAVSALAVTAQVIRAREGDRSVTTEVAFVLTFCVGALVQYGEGQLAGALAVLITLLLKFKMQLHRFARVLREADLYALIKFGVITLVVLPLVPREAVDPWGALNLHHVWVMVVLISGLGFAGYILMTWLGPGAGIGLTSALGGIATSTGVTLTFARQARENRHLARGFAAGTVLASTTSLLRVLVLVAIVSPPLAAAVWLPLVAAAGIGFVTATALAAWAGVLRNDPVAGIQVENPLELRPALTFAFLFSAALVALRLAVTRLGPGAVLTVAGATGLVGVDAAVLGLARMAADMHITVATAAQGLLLACAANTLFKVILVFAAGPRPMLPPAALGLGVLIVALAAGLLALPLSEFRNI